MQPMCAQESAYPYLPIGRPDSAMVSEESLKWLTARTIVSRVLSGWEVDVVHMAERLSQHVRVQAAEFFQKQVTEGTEQETHELLQSYVPFAPAIYTTADGGLSMEWIAPDRRLLVFLEENFADSGWAFVVKGGTAECGTLDKLSVDHFLSFKRTNGSAESGW